MTGPAQKTVEQRNAPRRRINKLGHLEVDETSVIACVVRNISNAGAMIMVRHSTYIPDQVTLVIPDEQIRRRARVKWRRARSIGVMFLASEV